MTIAAAAVALALYVIGAAWAYLLSRELAFATRGEAIVYAALWPGLAIMGIVGSVRAKDK